MASKKKVSRFIKKAARPPKKDTFNHYDLIIYASRNSQGARTLAKSLGCRRWFDDLPDRYLRRRPFFRSSKFPTIVNWGSTIHPEWGAVRKVVDGSVQGGVFINLCNSTATAINKLETFKKLSEDKVPCLKWATDKEQVQKWLKKGHQVFARKTLVGASGTGISLLDAQSQLAPAPLYTRNFPKSHEFRVHVFDGKAIDIVEKKRRLDGNDVPAVRNSLVRNHDNGWVFAHEGLAPDGESLAYLSSLAVSAVKSLGLVFGGVDILAILSETATGANRPIKVYKDGTKAAVVCEVNTGPGLENTKTIQAYSEAILKKHLETTNKRKYS